MGGGAGGAWRWRRAGPRWCVVHGIYGECGVGGVRLYDGGEYGRVRGVLTGVGVRMLYCLVGMVSLSSRDQHLVVDGGLLASYE